MELYRTFVDEFQTLLTDFIKFYQCIVLFKEETYLVKVNLSPGLYLD